METLEKYLDKDFFIEEINYNLESSIDNYFDLEIMYSKKIDSKNIKYKIF